MLLLALMFLRDKPEVSAVTTPGNIHKHKRTTTIAKLIGHVLTFAKTF